MRDRINESVENLIGDLGDTSEELVNLCSDIRDLMYNNIFLPLVEDKYSLDTEIMDESDVDIIFSIKDDLRIVERYLYTISSILHESSDNLIGIFKNYYEI